MLSYSFRAKTGIEDQMTPTPWITGLAALAVGGIVLILDGQPWVAVVLAGLAAAAGAMTARPPAPRPLPTPVTAPVVSAPADPLARGSGRALLEELPVGVLLIGRDRTIRFVNRAAVDMCALRVGAGRDVSALRVPTLLNLIETTLESGAAGAADLTISRGEDRHLSVQTQPVDLPRTEGERGILVTIEDVTRSRIANELHRDFVANASHELKTPLAAVSAIIETLLGHAREDPAATERFLGLMATQTARMARLVEDLLSLNRIELNERVSPRELEMPTRVISEVTDSLAPIAEAAGVRLIVDLPEPGPVILADRDELSQLFRNLIDNAIKYGGRGTAVTVRYVAPRAEAPKMVGFSVADEGPGIAREHIPRLTERFYRISVAGSREKGGTGLGLAIVKHATNRHRGKLEIQSKPGEGSMFTVWLPITANAPNDADKAAADSNREQASA